MFLGGLTCPEALERATWATPVLGFPGLPNRLWNDRLLLFFPIFHVPKGGVVIERVSKDRKLVEAPNPLLFVVEANDWGINE